MTNHERTIKEQKARIEELEKQLREKQGNLLEKRVTKDLIRIGMSANLKGYHYVRQAIVMVVLEPMMIYSITKLYEHIAEENSTTLTGVERAIRNAIEKAWLQGNIKEQEKMFGYTISPKKGKPTNSEFIAVMAERTRLEL